MSSDFDLHQLHVYSTQPCFLKRVLIFVIALLQALTSLFTNFMSTEAEFVNLLRSPGIDSQLGGPVRKGYLTYWPARLLAESIPWNRFLGSLNIYKFGLSDLPCSLERVVRRGSCVSSPGSCIQQEWQRIVLETVTGALTVSLTSTPWSFRTKLKNPIFMSSLVPAEINALHKNLNQWLALHFHEFQTSAPKDVKKIQLFSFNNWHICSFFSSTALCPIVNLFHYRTNGRLDNWR